MYKRTDRTVLMDSIGLIRYTIPQGDMCMVECTLEEGMSGVDTRVMAGTSKAEWRSDDQS